MYLYLLRHAETEWNIEERIQGIKDSPISQKGYKDIERVAREIATIPFDTCYTSDLLRAKLTAQNLLKNRNIPIIEVEALRELALGSWEGMLFKDIQTDPLWDVYFNRPQDFIFSDRDSFHALYRRLNTFIRHLLEAGGEHVLIVAHGVSIRGILNILEGVDISDFWHRPVAENMEISIAKYDENSWQVLRRGDKKNGLSY